jgi:hypothetical protein
VRPAKAKNNIGTYARPLISSALIAGGLMQLAAPVLAQSAPPAADATISNTAAATYDDGNGATIETQSNTVTIKVAKVAGIYVQEKGFTNSISGTTTFKRGDTIYSNFDVKNTGNDGVKFNVPKLASVTGNGTDGNTFQRVEYLAADGTTWVPVTTASGANSQVIPVNGILKVRVVLVIKSTAVDNSQIIVKLGQTVTPGAINLKRGEGVNEDISDNDIYTVDVTTADPVNGVIVGGNAANGVREASAQQSVGVNAPKQAVPSITLTNSAPAPISGQPNDNVDYNASVTVAKLDANGADNADLAPTQIQLNSSTKPTTADPGTGTTTPRVIVALPLPSTVTLSAAPTPPAGWTVVYAVTTGSVGTVVWSTTPPASLGDVKQVGFIYTPTGATTAKEFSLPANTNPYTGFTVKVTTNGTGTVDAIASVYGTTPDATGAPDLTKPAKADGTDSFTTTRTVGNNTSAIFNGPVANAEAKGPNGNNNTDFTNKSVSIASNNAVRIDGKLIPTKAETSATFSNAVKNTNSGTTDIYLLPTAPENIADLPDGTKVKITNTDGSDSRTYTYKSSDGTFTVAETGTPIKLSVGSGKSVGYKVDVTLPKGVDQLKGYPVPVTAFTGGTITAGMTTLPVDSGTGTIATFKPTAQNITIDRAYTGFIDLVKEVRVLDSVAQQDQPNTGAFTYLSGTVSSVKAEPGKFIQYRIRAVNISTPVDTSATDSQILKAGNLQIVENGNNGSNTWATQTTHESSTAKTLLGTTPVTSTITYDLGKSDSALDINTYTVKFADQIAPGDTAAPAFVFVRKVNAPALK